MYHAPLADAWCVGAGFAVAIVQIVVVLVRNEGGVMFMLVFMSMAMRVHMGVVAPVCMRVFVFMFVRVLMRVLMRVGLFRRGEHIVVVMMYIAVMVVVVVDIDDARAVLTILVMMMAMLVVMVVMMIVPVMSVGMMLFVTFNMQFAGCTAAGRTHKDLLSVRVTQSQSV